MERANGWLKLKNAAEYTSLSYQRIRELQSQGLFIGVKQGAGRSAPVLCHPWALDQWCLLDRKTPDACQKILSQLRFRLKGAKT